MINALINYLINQGFVQIEGDIANFESNQFTIEVKDYEVLFTATNGKVYGVKNYLLEIYFINQDINEFYSNFNYWKTIKNFLNTFNNFLGFSEINYEKIDNYSKSKLTITIREADYEN